MRYSRRYNDVARIVPMTGSRWRLPDAPLRASVAIAVAIAGLGTAGLALVSGPWTAVGATHVVKSLAAFAAMTTFVVGLAGAGHPFPRFGPANHVTLLRLAVVAVVAGLIGEPASANVQWFAAAATIVVASLDGLDGWLARRSHLASRFGARFDMETDAILILVLSALVWQHGKAGAWVLACGLMRYAFVACGWLLPWMARPLRSTRRGKAVAVGQLVGLGAALSPLVPPPVSGLLAAVTLGALSWSFAIDVAWLSRRYRTET